ncbi:MAG: hypothetical protein HC896_13135 [Bacteroidales bacterium]|nr:hypothetical protein [Bacteroidales bacterium]
MKLTVFLILLSTLSVLASKSYSQNKMLSLSLKNTTVKDVLSSIEDQGEFYFMYSEKLVDVYRQVSVDAKNQKVTTVLNNLFAGTDVTYTIKDQIIVLSTKEVMEKATPGCHAAKTGNG